MEGATVRQEQAAATKKKLLDSAWRIFSERGYKGTSVRAINRSVNLADGLLYHYFPGGKKEIFRAVIEENKKEIFLAFDRMKEEAYAELPLSELLEKVYTGFAALLDDHIDIARVFFREKEVRDFMSKEQMMQVIGARDPWLDGLLKQKYKNGEIREMDFEVAAMEIRSVLVNHAIAKVATECKGILEYPKMRKRLIDYQVSIWSVRE